MFLGFSVFRLVGGLSSCVVGLGFFGFCLFKTLKAGIAVLHEHDNKSVFLGCGEEVLCNSHNLIVICCTT